MLGCRHVLRSPRESGSQRGGCGPCSQNPGFRLSSDLTLFSKGAQDARPEEARAGKEQVPARCVSANQGREKKGQLLTSALINQQGREVTSDSPHAAVQERGSHGFGE